MLKLLIGQIPEAIFFSLFMIYAKGLKEKRVLFTILMVIEYLLLKYIFRYNWLFQICYMITTFLMLKILYKEKCQITDIFTFTIASIFLIISSAVFSLLSIFNIFSQTICVIMNRIFIFTMLYLFKDKLYVIQKLYKRMWNRNDKTNTKMKSITFRGLNLVIFNIIFYIINLGMIFAIYFNSM